MENASAEPIYDIEIRWYRGTAAHGDPDMLTTIFPGQIAGKIHDFPDHTNMDATDTVLRFRDAAGVRWRRRLDGSLTELDD
jgi:hypothetical protein